MELHKKRIEDLNKATQCPFEGCDLNFEDRIALAKHYDQSHDQENSPCGYCVKVIKKEKMRAHFFSEHPYKEYNCNICNKIFSFQSQLKQHSVGKWLF